MGRMVRAAVFAVLMPGTFVAPPAASPRTAPSPVPSTDTTGLVLPGVTVEARGAPGRPVLTAATDGAGQFTIGGLEAGVYELTFTLPGFQTVVRGGVAVGAGAAVTVDVEMAVELAERVVVLGSRAQPRSVTESQVPIDAIPFEDVMSQGAHDPRLSAPQPHPLVQRGDPPHQRRRDPRAAGEPTQPLARPHPHPRERQAAPPLVGRRVVRRGDRRGAGARHLGLSRPSPCGRSRCCATARRRSTVPTPSPASSLPAEGRRVRRQPRDQHRHLPPRRRRRLQLRRQRRAAPRRDRVRQPQPRVRQRQPDRPQRAAARRAGPHPTPATPTCAIPPRSGATPASRTT